MAVSRALLYFVMKVVPQCNGRVPVFFCTKVLNQLTLKGLRRGARELVMEGEFPSEKYGVRHVSIAPPPVTISNHKKTYIAGAERLPSGIF